MMRGWLMLGAVLLLTGCGGIAGGASPVPTAAPVVTTVDESAAVLLPDGWSGSLDADGNALLTYPDGSTLTLAGYPVWNLAELGLADDAAPVEILAAFMAQEGIAADTIQPLDLAGRSAAELLLSPMGGMILVVDDAGYGILRYQFSGVADRALLEQVAASFRYMPLAIAE